ncbi:hypothetical protein ACFFRE_13550, partial [Aciditerrimonas ferrireducens]
MDRMVPGGCDSSSLRGQPQGRPLGQPQGAARGAAVPWRGGFVERTLAGTAGAAGGHPVGARVGSGPVNALFDAVFGVFVVAIVLASVLIVRGAVRRDRAARARFVEETQQETRAEARPETQELARPRPQRAVAAHRPSG